MKKLICSVALFGFLSASFGQASGYLGKKNHVQLSFSAVPSFKHQNHVQGTIGAERLKYANMSYQFTYSRVFSSFFELSIGYQYANINCISDGVEVDDYDTIGGGMIFAPKRIMEDPQMTYHGGYVSMNFYRAGSLAPMGKISSIIIGFGNTTMAAGETAVIGERGDFTTNSFFKREGELEVQKDITLPEQKINSVYLKYRIGRSYPISDMFMIYAGITFPLLSYYNGEGVSKFGFSMRTDRDIETENDWTIYSMRSVNLYNQISLDAGLRFLF